MGIESPDFSVESPGSSSTSGKASRCLNAALRVAFSPDYDNDIDSGAVKTMRESIAAGNDQSGRWLLNCLEQGCNARCIMTETVVQGQPTLRVTDRRSLNSCAELSQ